MGVSAYKELDLIYFFTVGDKEVKCWSVVKGSTALQAAAVVHSDFARGFVHAEVVGYSTFNELAGDKGAKGLAEVKAAGKYRQEGKGYVIDDGDMIHFKFNTHDLPKSPKSPMSPMSPKSPKSP